jgi:retron-type reverse transcriptase
VPGERASDREAHIHQRQDSMNDKRQKNQLVLAFTEEGRREARKASQEGTESLTAKCETERPARHEQLMEGVCERRNCWRAYKGVKANKGSAGIEGMKVGELSGYLKQHWLSIWEQLLRGTYQPQAVRSVEIPKPDRGVRKLGIPTVLDRRNIHVRSQRAGQRVMTSVTRFLTRRLKLKAYEAKSAVARSPHAD